LKGKTKAVEEKNKYQRENIKNLQETSQRLENEIITEELEDHRIGMKNFQAELLRLEGTIFELTSNPYTCY
jgi:hypothetical protein